MNTPRAAFTLIELLIVLAIAGILLAIGYVALTGYVAKSRFIDAQQRLVGDFNRARSLARKNSANQAVTWATVGSGTQVSLNGTVMDSIPNMTITSVSPTATTFTYTAPHGRITTSDLTFTLSSGTRSGTVRVLGVTGKAVRDDQ